uniref:Neutral ceramidase n=1 Tax=Phallusia mammillata TaxID=59560 RepID=A0A6F9D7G3_9ASCI|nr:neutral ceramidase-like [Phallusia mammillata]
MAKHKRLEEEGDMPVHFVSTKSVVLRFLFGFIFIALLGTACVLLGYYFGFIDAFNLNNPTDQTPVSTTSAPFTPYDPVAFAEPVPGEFFVGVGRADVTGPIAQVNMMGYANPAQTAAGLHLRLYSRAFVVANSSNRSRVAFATVDCGMGSQIIKLEVVKRLKAMFGNNTYTERNVVISGTHSHSGPAGFFQTLLPEVTSLGAVKQTTDAFIDGIVKSIVQAHTTSKKGRLRLGTDVVTEGNINRSPYAYLKDPQNERDLYNFNTEQDMTLLKFEHENGQPIGMFNWFPVHGTSMNFSNELISSDNRGRASSLFEKMMRKNGENISGNESFVGAFASANLGDVSPRTKGPICVDSGLSCDFATSTCDIPPRVKNCVAFGPGVDMFDSTDIIAKKQFDTASRIFNKSGEVLDGSVGWVHQYVDMTKAPVKMDDGTTTYTCKPGMGYSFAAGTTDGAGAFNFVQSMTKGTLLWDAVRDDIIVKVVCSEPPPAEYYDCHHPKPVLLPTGYMDKPYAWHPTIIDIQMLKIGQLIIIAVPGEFTTMAGRRIKAAVKKEAAQHGLPNAKVVLAGLSNVYTHYIATPEEYTAQRYEGASTIYGPNTFTAYYQKYSSLVQAMVQGTQGKVDPGPSPANILDKQVEFLPPPSPDKVPSGKSFGDVVSDVKAMYAQNDKVSVTFYGANPRHNMKIGSTYLAIQQLVNGSMWKTILVDTDWETTFAWKDAALKTSPKTERNVITALFDIISRTTGAASFDYESAMQLYEQEGSTLTPTLRDVIRRAGSKHLSNSVDTGLFQFKRNSVNAEAPSVESHVTVEWYIPAGQQSGTYRVAYFGDHKTGEASPTPFTGYSSQFKVQA